MPLFVSLLLLCIWTPISFFSCRSPSLGQKVFLVILVQDPLVKESGRESFLLPVTEETAQQVLLYLRLKLLSKTWFKSKSGVSFLASSSLLSSLAVFLADGIQEGYTSQGSSEGSGGTEMRKKYTFTWTGSCSCEWTSPWSVLLLHPFLSAQPDTSYFAVCCSRREVCRFKTSNFDIFLILLLCVHESSSPSALHPVPLQQQQLDINWTSTTTLKTRPHLNNIL